MMLRTAVWHFGYTQKRDDSLYIKLKGMGAHRFCKPHLTSDEDTHSFLYLTF
jgi:hypothetical protein